jgi:putative two-component system response regulator
MASEYKDADTGAHIKRVSRYSAAVARRMGLDEKLLKPFFMQRQCTIWVR